MQSSDPLRVGEDWIFLPHPNAITVLLEDILQTRNRSVILNETNTRCEGNDDRNVEEEISLPALLTGCEWTRGRELCEREL